MKKLIVFLVCCLSFSVWAGSKRSAIDGIEDVSFLMKQLESAKYTITGMWIDCKLDILCVCDKKTQAYKESDNLMLRVLIEDERQNDRLKCDQMRKNYKICKQPFITEVQEALIPCYKMLQESTYLKNEILYNDAYVCIAETLQPFVAEKNPFALYVFVDFLTTQEDRYPGLLKTYQSQLEAQKNSKAYKSLMQCEALLLP